MPYSRTAFAPNSALAAILWVRPVSYSQNSAIENKGPSYTPRPTYGSNRGRVMGIATRRRRQQFQRRVCPRNEIDVNTVPLYAGYLFELGKGNLGRMDVRACMFRDGKQGHANFTDEHLAALHARPERIGNRKLGGSLHPVVSDSRQSVEYLSQGIRVRLLFSTPRAEIVRMSIPEIAFNQAVVYVLLFLQHSDATARELRQVRG